MLFVYALHHASTHGWTSPSTMAWFVLAVALMAAFVRIEARSLAPLIPTTALKNRTLVAANITAFLAFSALYAFIFLGSLLMQQELGYSPTQTGLAWLVTTITMYVIASAAGWIATAVGVKRLLMSALSLPTVGMLWLTQIPADASYLVGPLPAFLLACVGFGLCVPSLQIGALSGVRESETGLASGLVETMSEIGGATGVAAVSTALVAGTGLDGFHVAFAAIGILAALGVVTATTEYRRHANLH